MAESSLMYLTATVLALCFFVGLIWWRMAVRPRQLERKRQRQAEIDEFIRNDSFIDFFTAKDFVERGRHRRKRR